MIVNYISEQSTHDPVTRRVNKFGEFGTKMERIFRAAFRKDNINQSKQQLHPNIEESQENIPEYPEKIVQVSRRKLSLKTECLDSSNWNNKGKHSSRKDIHDFDDNIEGNKNLPTLNTRRIRRLKRSDHVKSNDLESNSLNVVDVDIHRENSREKSPKNIAETVIDITASDLHNNQDTLVSEINKKSLMDNSFDLMKRQRKRWSKETNIIHLPNRNSLSSPCISITNKSDRWANTTAITEPIPAPRNSTIVDIEEERDLGLDNKAFETENDDEDQVLRIETNHGVEMKTKIEIKSMHSASDESLNIQQLPEILQRHSDESDTSDIEKTMKNQHKIRSSSDNSSTEAQKRNKFDNLSYTKKKKNSKVISTVEDSTCSSDVQMIKTTSGIRKISINKKSKQGRLTSSSVDSKSSTSIKSLKKTKRKKLKPKRDDQVHENKFISVKIHRADMLVPEYITRHPMVIVHIVEESTGNYLKDPNPTKSNVTYLQPLITGTFDFHENKSMIPCWDEELIFEHDFSAVTNPENSPVLILFEIVDLPSFADASSTYDQLGGGHCWYKIAWAFLKPRNSIGTSHLDKPVRLQLYKPKKSQRKSLKARCQVYNWWKSSYRDKYPSTLFVTITSVDPPKLEPVFYGQLTLDDPVEISETSKLLVATKILAEPGTISRWSRLAAQSCKIPNQLLFKTQFSQNGCFYTTFSNNGYYLACANSEEYDYPIVIYKIDEGKIFLEFSGHKSFIYSLDWSYNDEFILSISSDQTARLWDVKNKIVQEINMLPHPSYVYCGKFSPANSDLIVTGCYDHITRLWLRENNTNNYELKQELEGHEGFVNSICFLKDGDLLTADSVGAIIQWTAKKKRGRLSREWHVSRKIRIREIVNIPINTIVLHPMGSRLLVHSRDNGLRMLDLATGVVLQKYLGLKNLRIQTAARISPCGSLLLCGGEDATLNIWNVESGKHVARYETNLSSPIACVDYHPYDHVLVYSVFGILSETVILKFDKQSSGQSVGLKLLDDQAQTERVMENSSKSTKQLSGGDETLRNTLVNDRDDLRSRLRMFNTSDALIKTKSANRLTGIIAKIDRILSNSGSIARPLYDIEANRIELLDEKVFLHREMSPSRPYVPPLFSTFEDNSTSTSKSELIEMTDMREMDLRTKRKKSKSARHSKTSGIKNDEQHKTLSDDAVTSRKRSNRTRDNCQTFHSSPWTTTAIPTVGDFQVPEIACVYEEKRDESSADSAGTYIIDQNDDVKFESESSVRSDVTFVIENEKTKHVPKPQKKKNDPHKIK